MLTSIIYPPVHTLPEVNASLFVICCTHAQSNIINTHSADLFFSRFTGVLFCFSRSSNKIIAFCESPQIFLFYQTAQKFSDSQLKVDVHKSFIFFFMGGSCIDDPSKWKMRELRQIHTADPVGMDRKSCLYTVITNHNSVNASLVMITT